LAKILIMRGLPGAGKSTWVKENYPDACICSADGYFLNENGDYVFDGEKISEAHAWCLRSFAETLSSIDRGESDSPDVVIVDNTCIRAWEISPYYNLASAYGHQVSIIQVDCDVPTAHSRNVHGVPLERVETMHQGLSSEELPPFWEVQVVPWEDAN
jgi:predicted kinase